MEELFNCEDIFINAMIADLTMQPGVMMRLKPGSPAPQCMRWVRDIYIVDEWNSTRFGVHHFLIFCIKPAYISPCKGYKSTGVDNPLKSKGYTLVSQLCTWLKHYHERERENFIPQYENFFSPPLFTLHACVYSVLHTKRHNELNWAFLCSRAQGSRAGKSVELWDHSF